MNPPKTFVSEKPGIYWVLKTYKSKSDPGKKPYEVRTSQRDGKTYCTCRGWIVALNAGHSVCCHIRDYKTTAEVVVMNKEDFESFRRGINLLDTDLPIDDAPIRRR